MFRLKPSWATIHFSILYEGKLESFTNSKEKFNPQGSMLVSISREGKGKRYSCNISYKDVSGKVSLSLQKTFRGEHEDIIFEEAALICLRQLKRFQKEKIEVCIPSQKLIQRIGDDFARGKSSRKNINDCLQLLNGFRFFRILAKEG